MNRQSDVAIANKRLVRSFRHAPCSAARIPRLTQRAAPGGQPHTLKKTPKRIVFAARARALPLLAIEQNALELT